MDQGTQNSILSWLAIVLSVGSVVIGVINKKRIISSCCGKKGEVSLDIQNINNDTKINTPPATPETKPTPI